MLKIGGRCSGRIGFTLIEVLAALVVLGVLLVGVVVAQSRLERQSARRAQRLEAIAHADRLLAQWDNPQGPPPGGSGAVSASLAWRTLVIDDAQAAKLGARVVRLEIVATATESEDVFVRVDVLAPQPDAEVRDEP